MKPTSIFFLVFSSFLFLACGNQTIASYNETIVLAHKELLKINEDFYIQSSKMIGNPKAKQDFSQLIDATKVKLIEAKKPVEELIQIKDHGLKKTMLEMYACSDESMTAYKNKIEVLVNPKFQDEALILVSNEIEKFKTLDELIKELQVQYAYYNNAKLH